MLQKFRIKTTELLNGPNARVIFVFSTLLLAALIGGAPSDNGGT